MKLISILLNTMFKEVKTKVHHFAILLSLYKKIEHAAKMIAGIRDSQSVGMTPYSQVREMQAARKDEILFIQKICHACITFG